ncbi:MASE3 domain-containing protein [Desulfobacterales bacterium HSG2]|nr:MASE3 domain-containing protein [Desulfobacterales bacterium HSG2]
MKKSLVISDMSVNLLFGISVLAGLYLTKFYNYLLFHSLAEMFSIVVACGIFMIAWNSRAFLTNHYILFIGIAYLFIAGMDMLHTLAYPGMGIFRGYGTNLTAQIWIAGRYVESLSLLIALLFLNRKLKPGFVFVLYTLIVSVFLGAIFLNIFPDCFIEGTGLTLFKKVSEYIICLVLAGSVFVLYQKREYYDRIVLKLISASVLVTIGSEFSFTLYADAYGVFNAVGHFLKIVSFYLIYKAIIETGLKKPYDLLFRDISQREQALGETIDFYHSILDGIINGVWVTDKDDVIFYANRGMGIIAGIPPDQFENVHVLTGFPESTLRFFRPYYEEAKNSLKPVFYDAVPVVTPEGRESYQSGWLIPRTKDNEYIGMICTVEDVTQAEYAKKALERQTKELERSNRDLEQFAYAVSHDLTEPLRMVSSYVQLLERRYKGKLDSDADDFIGFATGGAARMHTLINEMLAFSRVGTRGKPFGPVEAEHILEQTLTDLSVSIRESGAVVTHDALPRVIADASQLARVFQNLIANAVKFRGEEPPRIHITAEKNDGEWVFSFKDNGIGIAPKYSDRIFVIFQRLHTRDEYPGTGMGLAICKRIVERHGGRLWVESREGAGSLFCFTIPIKEENCHDDGDR